MSDGEKATKRGASSFDAEAEGFFGGVWVFGHLMVALALLDAFLFRNLLIPELVGNEAAITDQMRRLVMWACAVAFPLVLIYAITKRTARTRARLYQFGAWVFFGITVYWLVEDYQQYGEPGTFTTRINLAIGRIESFVGFELPHLE